MARSIHLTVKVLQIFKMKKLSVLMGWLQLREWSLIELNGGLIRGLPVLNDNP